MVYNRASKYGPRATYNPQGLLVWVIKGRGDTTRRGLGSDQEIKRPIFEKSYNELMKNL